MQLSIALVKSSEMGITDRLFLTCEYTDMLEGKAELYVQGFLAGQAVAYCERIKTGGGVAAQLVCPRNYASDLIALISEEGCASAVEEVNPERVSLWIYRDELVKRLIDELQSRREAASEVEIWSMGKLFGYADRSVLSFVAEARSVSAGEPSLRLCSDIACSRTEQGHCAY